MDRCLTRHGLIDAELRKRKRSDYKRWERSRAMELWQMDIVGGVRLADGTEAKIVSGIDDHSRFVISAHVVARATAGPVCDALELALSRHGVPDEILTDNGKVFTARFGPGPGPVRFDRICHGQGDPPHPDRTEIADDDRQDRALAQDDAQRVPHRQGLRRSSPTRRRSSMRGCTIYNHDRPHQSIGRVPPFERFQLGGAAARAARVEREADPNARCWPRRRRPGGSRRTARSVSRPSRTRPVCGSPARTSRSSATTSSSSSITVVCSSPPTHADIPPARSRPRHGQGPSAAADHRRRPRQRR